MTFTCVIMKNLGRIVGTLGGTFISKSEENLWDIDIKEFGASHARQNACKHVGFFQLYR